MSIIHNLLIVANPSSIISVILLRWYVSIDRDILLLLTVLIVQFLSIRDIKATRQWKET